MGFFGSLFRKETKEEKELEEKAETYAPAMIENEILCNKCGQVITGKPRYIKHQDRRLVFHKGCLKKLSMGNLSV